MAHPIASLGWPSSTYSRLTGFAIDTAVAVAYKYVSEFVYV